MKLHSPDRVTALTEAGLWGAKTWPELLAEHVRAMPDRLAVVDPPNLAEISGVTPQRLTWSELDAQVGLLAAELLSCGVGEGDVVGLQLPNSADLVTSYLAIASIGAIATPFPVQYRAFELGQMGQLAHLTAFIGSGRILAGTLADITATLREIPELTAILAFGEDLPDDVIALTPIVRGGGTATIEIDLDRDPNDAVTICWTSGTESTPKGVPRCPNDWQPMAISSVDAAELTVDDVLLNPFPMVNMAGIAGMLVPWLLTGAVLVQHHPFDAPTFFAQLHDEQVTYTVAPPALLIRALDLPGCTPETLASVRVIGSGSAPLPPSMIVAWRDRFGIDILNCFGSNEGISLVSDPRSVPDPVHRSVLFPRFGSAGHTWSNRASRGVRSKLIDPLTGDEVTSGGTPGELRLMGPGVFSGYLAGTASSNPFDADGFYCTGDLFQYVADDTGDLRFLQYVDRAKDLIVRGGMNISPAELESLIVEHPAVAEVAVVGTPDDTLGERTRAVVVTNTGHDLTLDEINTFLRERQIAKYKLPESLVIVEALPRNPVGKVLKRELRTRA
ncbi:class I adenylate-forming enzyme family protein [Aeromicrobium sp. P5_D10]